MFSKLNNEKLFLFSSYKPSYGLFLLFKVLRTFMVFRTSSDSRSLKILVLPRQVDDMISDLMEMDLSEGTVTVPFNGLLFEDFRVIVFFIVNYDI